MTTEQLDAMVRDACALRTAIDHTHANMLCVYAADVERHVRTLVTEVERLRAELDAARAM